MTDDRQQPALTPAEPEEVMSSIRLGLTLDSRGRPQGRTTADPQLRDSRLRLMAQRVYEQLRLSNFRIFRGPPVQPHGGRFPGSKKVE